MCVWKVGSVVTLVFSTRLVSITMQDEFTSQTILQKSYMVLDRGPWVAT